MMKQYLCKTERTREGELIGEKWEVLESPRNPLGEGFNQLSSPPIKNLVTESIAIEDILKLKEESDKLREELNNSINFHCKYYLSNDGGTVSCHHEAVRGMKNE